MVSLRYMWCSGDRFALGGRLLTDVNFNHAVKNYQRS